eukprot:2212947-Rhodomonas_salina.2
MATLCYATGIQQCPTRFGILAGTDVVYGATRRVWWKAQKHTHVTEVAFPLLCQACVRTVAGTHKRHGGTRLY